MNVPTCVDQDSTDVRASRIDISFSPWNLTERLSQKMKKAVKMRTMMRCVAPYAKFVSLYNDQQLNQLQKIACCILDCNIYLPAITGV